MTVCSFEGIYKEEIIEMMVSFLLSAVFCPLAMNRRSASAFCRYYRAIGQLSAWSRGDYPMAGRRLHTRRSFWRTGACNAEEFSKKGANYYLQQMKWIIESCLKPEFSNRPSKNHKSEEKRTITVCQSSQLSNRQRKSFTRESDWLARHFFAPELSNHLEK